MQKSIIIQEKFSWFLQWFDSHSNLVQVNNATQVDWLRVIPFILLHMSCLLVLLVGWSPVAIVVAVFSYLIRMFAITAFYHRYFAHRSFKTSRLCQWFFALLGASATQRGPLWWAAHHRRHHIYSDQRKDVHSPRDGFFWSHIGWFLSKKNFATRENSIRDFAKYPELQWLDRFDIVVPVLFAAALWWLGDTLQTTMPELQTSGWQMLVWGYCIDTILLLHATLLINSLAHKWGSKRFETGDDSRNNAILALLSLGEGWHNNHHHYPVSVKQGFYWWEIDVSYYLLRMLNMLGIIWDLKEVPSKRLFVNRIQGS